MAAVALALSVSPAAALTLNPNLTISGVQNSNSPGGGGTLAGDPFPWLTLNITTVGTGGGVTIQGWSSVPPEWFYRALYLNIGNLESTLAGAQWAASDLQCTYCIYSTISVASNAQVADVNKFFDVFVAFETPNTSGDAWNRFSSNDMFSFTLTCTGDPDCASFNENSFDVLSSATNAPGDTSTPSGFRIAAHLQGLPPNLLSTWIAGTGGPNTFTGPPPDDSLTKTSGTEDGPAAVVPEPGTMTIIGAGLLGLGLLRRRTSV